MEYDLITHLGACIENVYCNTSEDGSRKTISKIVGDNKMSIEYITIINAAREIDIHNQIKDLQKETNEMISSRLKTIKSEFKSKAGRALVSKKVDSCDSMETLTVSPYSPHRKILYRFKVIYDVK